MYETIVVAVDGSDSTEGVLNVVGGLARKLGSTVEVVHVHEHDPVPAKAGMSPDLETPVEAKTMLDGFVEKLRAEGVTANGRLAQAHTRDVAKRIIAEAEAAHADLIVVGRRGLSSFGEMLVGSVSNKLVHLSPIPVLVAK